jgi:hypothetical protein
MLTCGRCLHWKRIQETDGVCSVSLPFWALNRLPSLKVILPSTEVIDQIRKVSEMETYAEFCDSFSRK